MNFIDKVSYGEDYEPVQKYILGGLVNITRLMIQVGSIGSIDLNFIHSCYYYMVKFIYSPYSLQ